MEFPRLDPKNWTSHRIWPYRMVRVLPFLVIVLMAVAGILFSFGFSSIARDIKRHHYAYVPENINNQGFIGKTNRLLSELLEIQDTSVQVTSLSELNKRYPALHFALPYDFQEAGSSAFVRTEDIRLVGIEADSIKDPKLLEFYRNSSLSGLLSSQKKNYSEKLFKIKCTHQSIRKGRRTIESLEIQSIKIIASMFKVPLYKDPWTGVIVGQESSLFPSSDCVFLITGDNVLPLPKQTGYRDPYKVNVSVDNGTVSKNHRSLDYFDYYQQVVLKNCYLKLSFEGGGCKAQDVLDIYMSNNGTTFSIKPNGSLSCEVFTPGDNTQRSNGNVGAGASAQQFSYVNGLRVLVRRGALMVGELTLSDNNPANILSTQIRTNKGTSRYVVSADGADLFSRQVERGISRNLGNGNCTEDTVHLSLDLLLSREFQKELRQYLDKVKSDSKLKQKGDNWEISMTVMDLATGEIIAAPFASDEIDALEPDLQLTRKSPALVRMYIGSTFKPLLALAAVQTNHSLLQLNTIGKYSLYDDHASFFGAFIRDPWAKKLYAHWRGRPNMSTFIAESDDVYPVALAALALNGYPDTQDLSNLTNMCAQTGSKRSIFSQAKSGSDLKMKDENSSDCTSEDFELLKNIDVLYHVHSYSDYMDFDTLKNDLWRFIPIAKSEVPVDEINFGLDEITPEVTNMHYEMFFNGGSMKSILEPWVLGQGNNYWSTLKIAEAWSRMMTKQPLRYTIVQPSDGIYYTDQDLISQLLEVKNVYDPSDTKNKINNTWNGFLDEFKRAQTIGNLLPPMNKVVLDLNRKCNSNLVLFSKTGTPDNYFQGLGQSISGRPIYFDVGLYIFSLMTEEALTDVKSQKPGRGVTCVIRIVHTTPNKQKGDGLGSSYARDFFSMSPERFKKFYYMTKKYY